MLPSVIIDRAFQKSYTNATEIGDGVLATGTARAYQYLNDVKDRMWSRIVSSTTGKDISWQQWTESITAGQ